jgi:hypothetical protein
MKELQSDVDRLLHAEAGAAAALMDAAIMERVHHELAPCSWERFLRRYCELHEAKYIAPFTVD